MCVSERASIIAFCLGVIFVVILIFSQRDSQYRDPVIAISVIWLWVLGMQVAEFFIWRDRAEANKCGIVNRRATNAALILNLTQPLIVFVALMILNVANVYAKIAASIVLVFYVCHIIYFLNNSENYSCVEPQKNCSGLDLLWWKKASGKIFLFSIIVIFLLLCRPTKVAVFACLFIVIALIISNKFYSCNQPSMWCFLVVAFPIFLIIYIKIIEMKTKF
jgi:hypothetical protein